MSSEPSGPLQFSVIMPIFNRAPYVGEAIQSVVRQTWPHWELIIVDDGSTDSTPAILDRWAAPDARIIVLHQKNVGAATARNAAIACARRPWLAYIDSDDLWFPDALEQYARYIAAHPQARFIHGYANRLREDGAVKQAAGDFQDRATGTAELFGRMFLCPLGVCHRRELLDLAGRFDESLPSTEDYDLYLRMSLHCRLEPLGRPVGLRRRHATNISRQTGPSRLLEAEILSRFAGEHGREAGLSPQAVRRRLGFLYYAAGRQFFKAGCYREAIAAIRESRRYRRTFKGEAVALAAGILRPLQKRTAARSATANR